MPVNSAPFSPIVVQWPSRTSNSGPNSPTRAVSVLDAPQLPSAKAVPETCAVPSASATFQVIYPVPVKYLVNLDVSSFHITLSTITSPPGHLAQRKGTWRFEGYRLNIDPRALDTKPLSPCAGILISESQSCLPDK